MASPVEDIHDPFEHYALHDLSQSTMAENAVASSSADHTDPASPSGRPREKKRVGFTGSDPTTPTYPFPSSASPGGSASSTPIRERQGSEDYLSATDNDARRSHLPELSRQDTEQIKRALGGGMPLRPRPVLRHTQQLSQTAVVESEEEGEEKGNQEKAYRKRKAREALQRGRDLERDERIQSEPNSRYTSPHRRKTQARSSRPILALEDVPLTDDASPKHDSDDDTAVGHHSSGGVSPRFSPTTVAENLIEQHRERQSAFQIQVDGLRSGAVTPIEERQFFEDYRPPPTNYRGGILGALMKLQNHDKHHDNKHHDSIDSRYSSHNSSGDLYTSSDAQTPIIRTPDESGASTPRGKRNSWYSYSRNHSTSSLAQLVGATSGLASPAVGGLGEDTTRRLKKQKEQNRKSRSHETFSALNKRIRNRNEEIRIKTHISEIIQRQRYLIKLCRALMMYGAPTHRLEEYMKMSSRVLEMEAQFLYIPGAMIMSFNDPATHTTEVKLVKEPQGLDLGKLRDVHEVYKDVVHDRLGVESAMSRLHEITSKKPKFSKWILVWLYGLASVCVGPFAFQARLIDLPISFLLGCIVGFLQLFVAPRSDLYANVFEIIAAVVTSFLARAFGSINGGNLFCFSALAQSSIALILPGYTVLLASLELQSKSLVAGSVRMVYAIIYSLFLGYGITIGTAIYGIIDHNATSKTTCNNPVSNYWIFFFVPAFTMCLIIINQAKWKQAPMMMIISFAGYVVNFFAAKRFAGNTQVANTLGALAIGVLANGYSRVGSRVENFALDVYEQRIRPRWKTLRRRVFRLTTKGTPKKLEEGVAADNESIYTPQARRVGYSLAAAAMLPAIFVQVPSGLAVSGSLVSGIASANAITFNNATSANGTIISNVTSIDSTASAVNTVAFNVSVSVIQVAIGITCGLFLSAIVVYPFGKKRSGLFSF